MNEFAFHQPVLLSEVLAGLEIQNGAVIVDGTLGDGGHSATFLEKVGATGLVIGVDRDPEAIAVAKRRLAEFANFQTVHGNFSELPQLVASSTERSVGGVLLDLGWSSTQFTSRGRGFSFMLNEPLDMRYDPTEDTATAADIINTWSAEDLQRIFRLYGEERRAQQIADALVAARAQEKIATTQQLANLVARVAPRHSKLHPATQIFQALRIAVNDELSVLRHALENLAQWLPTGARLAVITFHSGEDRVVKTFSRQGTLQPLNKKVIKPTRAEILLNPRARSAKLRLFIKK